MQDFIGLGTAAIGRPQYINIRQETPTKPFDLEAFKTQGKTLLDKAYASGIRYFDTAPGYGMAEQLLIDWLQDKKDDTIEVATKWGYTYVADFDLKATIHEVKDHSLTKLNEQWERSQRLFPFLTTYQIHSATFETAVLENKSVLEKLAALKNTHNIHIGLSTTGSNQVDVLRKALSIKVNDIFLFDAFQMTFNILDQSVSEALEDTLLEGRRIIVKEALANGRIFPNEKYPQYKSMYDVLQKLANKYQVGIDAIALRFCIDTLSPYKVLSGASNAFHLAENLKATDFKLSQEELSVLRNFSINPKEYWTERKRLGWN